MAGKLYALNVAGFSKLDGTVRKQIVTMKGQAKVIFDELRLNRSPRTIASIAEAVDGKFETVQSTLKVVTYYIVKWRSEGVVAAFGQSVDDASVDEAFDEIVAELTAEDDEQLAIERAEAAEE